MSVFENIAFGLRVRPRSQRPTKQRFATKSVPCSNSSSSKVSERDFPISYPEVNASGWLWHELLRLNRKSFSWMNPSVSLDAKVRKGLRDWLRGLHDELNTTTILVTHDQEEALEVSDRVVVMNQARIEQVGPPADVFHHPKSEFVMDFLGNVNVFHARTKEGQAVLDSVRVQLANPPAGDDEQTKVYVRPNEITIHPVTAGGFKHPRKNHRINLAGVQAKLLLPLKTKRSSEPTSVWNNSSNSISSWETPSMFIHARTCLHTRLCHLKGRRQPSPLPSNRFTPRQKAKR